MLFLNSHQKCCIIVCVYGTNHIVVKDEEMRVHMHDIKCCYCRRNGLECYIKPNI